VIVHVITSDIFAFIIQLYMLLLSLILKKKEKDKVSSFSFFFFKVCVYSWPLWITNFTKLTLCMHCEGWFSLLQVYFCRAEWLTLQSWGCQTLYLYVPNVIGKFVEWSDVEMKEMQIEFCLKSYCRYDKVLMVLCKFVLS